MSTSATSRAASARRTSAEASQMALLEVAAPSWRLDRRTREIGRRGVASAREALRRAGEAEAERGRHAEAA